MARYAELGLLESFVLAPSHVAYHEDGYCESVPPDYFVSTFLLEAMLR